MILLDLFSGIGGFHLGLEKAGFHFDKVLFSEIDKYAIANYKYNFKNSEYAGAITDINGRNIPRPNIITFGSPCQDFSLAGKRKGMDGQRSSLITEAIRLIDETRPDVFIWENVKGAFSSNDGEDFWAIIKAFADLGGYQLEWQLLNTSWLLPQNRERIYIVGHLTGRSEPGIFPIGENGKLHNQGEQTATSQIASTLNATDVKSWVGNFIDVPKIAGCLTAGGNSGGLHSDMTIIKSGTFRTHNDGKGFRENIGDCVPTIPARARKDGSGQPVIENIDKSIRRLTEIECERLQGFTDNHTKYGDYNGIIKLIPKTQRYKMIGNAVTVAIVELVGKRLLNQMNIYVNNIEVQYKEVKPN